MQGSERSWTSECVYVRVCVCDIFILLLPHIQSCDLQGFGTLGSP